MTAYAAKARMAIHRAASEAVSAVLSPGTALQAMLGAAGMPYWLSGLFSSAIPLAWAAPQALASRGLGRLAGNGRILALLLLLGEGFLAFPLLALALGADAGMAAMLATASLSAFNALDGLASPLWMDLLARVAPKKARSSLLGKAQAVGSLGGILMGIWAAALMGRWGAIWGGAFSLASACLTLIPPTLALVSLKASSAMDGAEAEREPLPASVDPSAREKAVRLLTACRIAAGLSELALAHYPSILLAAGLPPQAIGAAFAFRAAGAAAGGFALGALAGRFGSKVAVASGSALAAATPLLIALSAGTGSWESAWLAYALQGALGTSWYAGFYAYLLEAVPSAGRPRAIARHNGIVGMLFMAPAIGGFLLTLLPREAVLGAASCLGAASLALAMALP
jgi:MFS family permease